MPRSKWWREAAVLGGNLAALRWINRMHPDALQNAYMCELAAGAGQLGVLQFLRDPKCHPQHGACPWDARKCERVARDGVPRFDLSCSLYDLHATTRGRAEVRGWIDAQSLED